MTLKIGHGNGCKLSQVKKKEVMRRLKIRLGTALKLSREKMHACARNMNKKNYCLMSQKNNKRSQPYCITTMESFVFLDKFVLKTKNIQSHL